MQLTVIILVFVVGLQPAIAPPPGAHQSKEDVLHKLQASESTFFSHRLSATENKYRNEIINRYEQNKDYLKNRFKDWIQEGIVRKGEYPKADGKGSMEMYTFSEDPNLVKNLKLKQVFQVLQGYFGIFGDRKQRVFEMNIGGEMTKFRLSKHFLTRQLMFYTSEGKMEPYNFFVRLNKPENRQENAQLITDALDRSLSNQPNFNERIDIPDNKAKQTRKQALLYFMLGSHISEAAHPDPYHENIDKIFKAWREGNINSIASDVKTVQQSGRTFGSDLVTRRTLKEIANGVEGKGFDTATFVWSQESGGARAQRVESIQNGDVEYSVSSDSETDVQNRRKRKRHKSTGIDETVDQISVKLKAATGEQEKYVQQKIIDGLKDSMGCSKSRRRRRSLCNFHDNADIEIKDVSVTSNENSEKVSLKLINHDISTEVTEITIMLDKEKLLYNRYIEHLTNGDLNGENIKKSFFSAERRQSLNKLSSAMGVYGLLAGIAATGREFSKGNYGRSSLFLSQTVYSIGSMTTINNKLAKVSKAVLTSGLKSVASRIGLEKTIEKMAAKFLASSVGRFASAEPFVSVGLDIAFIGLDIEDIINTNFFNPEELIFFPLKITHLRLDQSTTLLNLLGAAEPELLPLIEPAVIALTIERMAIDDFYIDILDSMRSVQWKSPWAIIKAPMALFYGIIQGAGDFVTGGLIRNKKYLKKEHDDNLRLLHQLASVSNYFTIHGSDGEELSQIDFTGGPVSSFGGDIQFTLFNNYTAQLCLLGMDMSGESNTQCKVFQAPNSVKDIVLGVGESRDFKFKTKTAKLWWFIPIKSEDVICGENLRADSLHGSYRGNDDDNQFIAVQDVPANRNDNNDECAYGKINFEFTITHYHYNLFGGGGKDTFLLGPQDTYVEGGPGSDMYLLSVNKSSTIINNYSKDKKRDFMFIKSNFVDVKCYREHMNLKITNDHHYIQVKKWFSAGDSADYQHLLFHTQDGFIFSPLDIGWDVNITNTLHPVSCNCIVEDKSASKRGEIIDMRRSPYDTVLHIIGSNQSDTIHGNDKGNQINGLLGNDFLTGYNGTDTYIINFYCLVRFVMINNYADDHLDDIAILPSTYNQISAIKIRNHLRITDGLTSVYIVKWFLNASYQHLSFISADHITFTFHYDKVQKKVSLALFMLDYSGNNDGVKVDLTQSDWPLGIVTIIDSKYNDVISGNKLPNFLSCSGGRDILRGNGGHDKYVIHPECGDVTIENYDDKERQDILFLNYKSPNYRFSRRKNDLQSHGENITITFKEWFKGKKYQHLIMQTLNGITAELPISSIRRFPIRSNFLHAYQVHSYWNWRFLLRNSFYPIPLEFSKDPPICQQDVHNKIKSIYLKVDLNNPPLEKVQRIELRSPYCIYNITGNSINNYLNPGPNYNGVQYLNGGNGSDTYHIVKDTVKIVINNMATDKIIDKLLLDVTLEEVNVKIRSNDVVIEDKDQKIFITLTDFILDEIYQHIDVHTSDGYMFRPQLNFPHIQVISVDQSDVPHSCNISLTGDIFSNAKFAYGSVVNENIIEGNNQDNKLMGGSKDDVVNDRQQGNDWIETFEGNDKVNVTNGINSILTGSGNDTIEGGEYNDIILPGYGADIVNGGYGKDTIIFQGNAIEGKGVHVNLTRGIGLGSDAEGDIYYFVENIWGSDFDDILVGNGDDNEIRAFSGHDIIVPYHGSDTLSGGEGVDMYFLRGASGYKSIDNWALLSEPDYVVVDDRRFSGLCMLNVFDDLYLHWGNSLLNGNEILGNLDIIFYNWYANASYRHVNISMKDKEITEEFINEYLIFNATYVVSENPFGNLCMSEINSCKNGSHKFKGIRWNSRVVTNALEQCQLCKVLVAAYKTSFEDDEDMDAKLSHIFEIDDVSTGQFFTDALCEDNKGEFIIELVLSGCGIVLSKSPGLSVTL